MFNTKMNIFFKVINMRNAFIINVNDDINNIYCGLDLERVDPDNSLIIIDNLLDRKKNNLFRFIDNNFIVSYMDTKFNNKTVYRITVSKKDLQ